MDTTHLSEREVKIFRAKQLQMQAESAKQSGNLEEAKAFALGAAKIIRENQLKEWELQQQKDDISNRFKNWKYNEPISYADNQSGSRWKRMLVAVLCEYNFCRSTITPKRKEFRVYGDGQNVDKVIYMYYFLSIGFLRIAQQHHTNLPPEIKKQYNRYAYLKDFLLGAVSGLSDKLEEDRQQAQRENCKVTALIVYNDKALDEYIAGADPKLGKARKKKKVSVGEGFSEGEKVGRTFKIGERIKPVEKTDKLNPAMKLLN